MNENIHAIIHKPFEDLSGLVKFWDTQCEAIAVAQHDKDSKVPRIHCHILIINPVKKTNAFNEDIKKFIPGHDGRKDSRLSIKTQNEKKPISRQGLWYLVKGQESRLKFSNNFSNQEIEDAIKLYDPNKAKRTSDKPKNEKKEKKPNQWEIIEEIRSKVLNKNDPKDIWDIMINQLEFYQIRTGMFDLEKWFVTIQRTDKEISNALRHKIISKLYS